MHASPPDARTPFRRGLAVAEGPGVLIVESDPDFQWSLARALTQSGCRVMGTSSADGALEVIAAWRMDVIVVAEDLPGMNGLELVRSARGVRPATPIILLSNEGPGLDDVASRTGASHVLRKPVRVEDVRALVIESHSARDPR